MFYALARFRKTAVMICALSHFTPRWRSFYAVNSKLCPVFAFSCSAADGVALRAQVFRQILFHLNSVFVRHGV